MVFEVTIGVLFPFDGSILRGHLPTNESAGINVLKPTEVNVTVECYAMTTDAVLQTQTNGGHFSFIHPDTSQWRTRGVCLYAKL
ncbi:hypothetical protein M514_06756 [Trichuris suis]|uniref:Uncharacterized protein n=1 Tax=Trichuris suis TaxID=68888 RepID=A0A085NKG0_9BILA|nr:hypothetical protein M514_06756 [Trichuris suis]